MIRRLLVAFVVALTLLCLTFAAMVVQRDHVIEWLSAQNVELNESRIAIARELQAAKATEQLLREEIGRLK